MAGRNDPNSATAQFFIKHADNTGLDYPSPDGFRLRRVWQGCAGHVDRRQDRQRPNRNRNMHQNIPLEPVVIQSIEFLSNKK